MAGITRRAFIEGLGLGTLTTWHVANASTLGSAGPATEPPHSRVVESWMNTWMEEASREPVGALHVSRFMEPMYYLLKPITWRPNPGQEHLSKVTVPAGFVTDFASIPRVFFTALRPDGEYTYPAIVHDYLYWAQTRPRDICDAIFKAGMEDFGISSVTIGPIYGAVRGAGELSWKNNARRKKRGEKRVLKKFPDDPRTRWADWKKRPDVFE